MIYLETERLILRDYTENDVEEYSRLMADDQVMYYLQDIQHHSREESEEDFRNILLDMREKDRQRYFLHIQKKDTGEQIGSIGYTVTDTTPAGKLVHLGYFTYPKYWGCDYVTEALEKVMEFAFSQDGVYRITTGCLRENRGSERVMQKCEMIREAELVDYEWHDGKMKTRMEYRMLKSDWEKMRQDSTGLNPSKSTKV